MINRRNFLTTSVALGAAAALPVVGEAYPINQPAVVIPGVSFHTRLCELDAPFGQYGFFLSRDEVRLAMEKIKEPVKVRSFGAVHGTATYYIPPDINELWADVTILEGPQAQLIEGRKQQKLKFDPGWVASVHCHRLRGITFLSLWLTL